jgi:hypothetical protein
MFKTKKLNNEVVKPCVVVQTDVKQIKGGQLFPVIYPNVFICASKGSGKTSTIFHTLKKCTSNPTEVFIFSNTHDTDETWKQIKEWLEQKGNTFYTFKSIKNGKEDTLQQIMETMREAPEDESTIPEENLPPAPIPIFFSEAEERRWKEKAAAKEEKMKAKIEKKKKGKGKIYPKRIFVFDDISGELKSPSLDTLLKQNRHFKAMTIVSSQYFKDLKPSARGQFQFFLIFPRIRDDTLEVIHKDSGVNIDFEDFMKMYKMATSRKYNFFYIDTKNMKFRHNFNKELTIKCEEDSEEDDEEEDD